MDVEIILSNVFANISPYFNNVEQYKQRKCICRSDAKQSWPWKLCFDDVF